MKKWAVVLVLILVEEIRISSRFNSAEKNRSRALITNFNINLTVYRLGFFGYFKWLEINKKT